MLNFGIPNRSQSTDIEQNSNDDISNFLTSVQSLVKVNCHNSRTNDDIVVKLVPVAKLNRKNKTKLKINYDVIARYCDVTVTFPKYDQFGAIQKLQSGRIVCKTSIITTFRITTL